MARSIEVELKFEIMHIDQVQDFVAGLEPIGKKHVVDVYLDTATADLFKKGIFIRIRNNKTLDIKFNKEDIAKSLNEEIEHTHCDEVSNDLPLAEGSLTGINETLESLGLVSMQLPTLEELMARNQLVESIVIDKERMSYRDGDFHIDVDSVKDLGEYIEIEKMTDEHDDIQSVLQLMRDRLKNLDLRHIDTGYNELYWRKHDFTIYLQGKYLLEKDRRAYRKHSIDLSSHGIVALVRNESGAFLLLEDGRKEMYGYWAPPHGRCEPTDVSEEAGVVREVFEETGLRVKPIRKLLTQPADTKVRTVSFWLVDVVGGDLNIDATETSHHAWLTIKEAQKLKLYPGTKLFFGQLESGAVSL